MGVNGSKVQPTATRAVGKSLFISRELIDGEFQFASNEALRQSYAAYIKSGVWIDQILLLVPNGTIVAVAHEVRLAQENSNALMEYKHVNGCFRSLDGQDLLPEKRRSFNLFKSPRSSGSEKKAPDTPPRSRAYSSDCYADIHESGHYTSAQLIAILFGVLYPLYMASTEYRRFQEGLPLIECEPSISAGPGSFRDAKQYSTQARRAQEMMLSCAATYDETDLLEALSLVGWTDVLAETFADSSFGITVSDANKEGAPTVYANHAFESLTGYSVDTVLGRNLDMLNGPHTESGMARVLREAVRQPAAAKVALSHRNFAGKKFLNLVSVRPSGGYSIVVHYPPTKGFKQEDLKAVDDLQVLLSLVVRAPALNKIKRAPSAWIMQPLASLRNTLSKRSLH
eukprot:gene21768-24684_t